VSYKRNVDGLTRLNYEPDGTGAHNARVRIDGLAGNGTQFCSGIGCPGPAAGEGTFSAVIGDINFFAGADYFTVGVNIRGPGIRGRGCKTPDGPTDTPCDVLHGEAFYDGVVEPDGWAKWSPDPPGWVSVPNTYEDNNVDDNSVQAVTDWPSVFPHQYDVARLINPVPVWPLVDGEGNVFGGMHLFTLAQLPSAISTTITYWGYNQPGIGFMTVSVSPYVLGDVEVGGSDDFYIVGAS
jgi:hypothetical protein